MSDETRETSAGGGAEDRRSGKDRRQAGERRRESRGVWNLPILGRLLDRRQGGDRRSGRDRRKS